MKITRRLEIRMLVALLAGIFLPAILLPAVSKPVEAASPLSANQAAQPPQPSDDQVNAIARQLYCPVCENIPLDVCPTQACMQWRELIREKLGAGWTEQQIKDYFVQQYGDRVLATPPPRGLNWLAYILPPVLILLGAYILYRVLLSWKRATAPPGPQSPETPSAAQDDYVTRLEEELRKY
jgi:cytochrome c-type biogenesis protein CcmH